MRRFTIAMLVFVMLTMFVAPVSADGPCDTPSGMGQLHAELAQAGNIGQPGVAAHNPGAHQGKAGLCGVHSGG